ncbi:MAG TPA: dTDP-4-amino-4,6-dideoxygalactose transaminase [Candidatus Limiplasma stercoravium]|nr:dTDP-4-amino-4,6-dideoxygalactose transaminase [Candidatus Limiplasma stercoravium]
MIPFNIPPYVPKCSEYVSQAMANRKICGDGPFTKRCSEALERMTGAPRALLTTSGTSALEMAALLMDIQPGDEVVMPSFTFVSTANAFVLRGADIVFADICEDTLNLDPRCVQAALTPRTRAVVPVHYAGVCCDMDAINAIAAEHRLKVVEDAAQAVGSLYHGRPAGTLSDVGCFSFHETKNYSMGEGGAVVLNDAALVERAEIIREKGTDRSRFYRGQVDKYTWQDVGSSFLPSELNAAYLLAQLEEMADIAAARMRRWEQYHEAFAALEARGAVRRMYVPEGCIHNAHMYYLILRSQEERAGLIAFLRARDISAVFHYVPLHSAAAGRRFGRFHGEDRNTTRLSERLLRLPMYYDLGQEACERVIEAVYDYFERRNAK